MLNDWWCSLAHHALLCFTTTTKLTFLLNFSHRLGHWVYQINKFSDSLNLSPNLVTEVRIRTLVLYIRWDIRSIRSPNLLIHRILRGFGQTRGEQTPSAIWWVKCCWGRVYSRLIKQFNPHKSIPILLFIRSKQSKKTCFH